MNWEWDTECPYANCHMAANDPLCLTLSSQQDWRVFRDIECALRIFRGDTCPF